MLKGQGKNITMMTITVRDLMRKRVDTIEETEIFSEGIRSIKKSHTLIIENRSLGEKSRVDFDLIPSVIFCISACEWPI